MSIVKGHIRVAAAFFNGVDKPETSLYVHVMFFSDYQTLDAMVRRNLAALKVIVAPLLALLVVQGDGGVRVSRGLRVFILRVLRPAESAVRRLIVIAARDFVVAERVPPGVRSKVKALRGGRVPVSRMAFQLFDPRKRFGQRARAYVKKAPRIFYIEADAPVVPLFRQPEAAPDVPSEKLFDGRRLALRIKAVQAALEDVPSQARRLARWRQRRERRNLFSRPLRMSAPPGHRKIPQLDVDRVLAQCHAAAKDLQEPVVADTS